MINDSAENFFSKDYYQIKSLFEIYNIKTKADKDNEDNEDDDDDYDFGFDDNYYENYRYIGPLIDTIPDSAEIFYELLDTDNYILNIIGEPFYMLDYLVQKNEIPDKSELYGLANILKVTKAFGNNNEYYPKKITKQEILVKHLSSWSKQLTIVNDIVLKNEFSETNYGYIFQNISNGKGSIELLINSSEGFNRIYNLLSNPKYVFITHDYLDIFDRILPHGSLTRGLHWRKTPCLTDPTSFILSAKEQNAIYDISLIERRLTPNTNEYYRDTPFLELDIPFSEKKHYRNEPNALQILQRAILKNKFKNAILIADLYANFNLIDDKTLQTLRNEKSSQERYDDYIRQQEAIKWAVDDWEDTMSDLGIHEDEL